MNQLTEMNNVMTSLELLQLLNQQRLTHMTINNLHRDLKVMFEEEIKDGSEIEPSLDSRGYVQFYTLNEILSKMFVASKDKKYLRKITQYWVDKKQPKQEIAPLSQADSFMALQLMTNDLNLPDSGKLQAYAIGMQNYPNFVKALPVYAVDKPIIDNFVEVNTEGSSGATHALSYHLKNHNIEKSAIAINKLLLAKGIIEKKDRISSTGKIKYFNSLTEKGLKYGKNITNPKSQRETQPHYYDSMIDGLFGELE